MRVETIRVKKSKPVDGLVSNPLKCRKGELKLVLLGTGNPFGGFYRTRPASILVAGSHYFLIDCGSGAVQRLLQAGVFPSQVNHLFFTHHHADHNAGFIDFVYTSCFPREVPRREQKLMVLGPTNTVQVLTKMRDSLDYDFSTRPSFTPEVTEIEYKQSNGGLVYQQDDVKVFAFEVDHGNYSPAVGYRFEYLGKVVVFSGDTRPCEGIRRYSKGAHILVHESYNPQFVKLAGSIYGNSDTAVIINNAQKKHTSVQEVAQLAAQCQVNHLVLTHHIPSITPDREVEREYIKGMKKIFKGPITVGRDLTLIS